MSLELKILDLGNAGYKEVEVKQLELAKLRADDLIPDTMLIAEHPPTITTGSKKKSNVIHVPTSELAAMGIEFYETRRGGGATALGPGQLTFYPVIDLSKLGTDLNKFGISIYQYMRAIDGIVHNFSKRMGAKTVIGMERDEAMDRDYECVWHVNRFGKVEKFLAQGYKYSLHADLKITKMGGFSIYIDKRAHQHFHLIDHCGFKLGKVGATSFEEMLGYNPGRKKIKDEVLKGLQERFDYDVVHAEARGVPA